MAPAEQLEFAWPESPGPSQGAEVVSARSTLDSTPTKLPERFPDFESVPVAPPLKQAIEEGVFGVTETGPIEPDDEQIQFICIEQAQELVSLLADLQTVEDGLRTGEDPRTGKMPRTPKAAERLHQYLESEIPRLTAAYGDVLASYSNAFGDEAGSRLDLWVRKVVADCTIEPRGRYDPGHPWHYYHEGDNAPPIAVEDIDADPDAGRFLQNDLPKNRVKRLEKMESLLATERQRVDEDKQRYQEIVERGAEALSRYDREIAHTSDEMARATALSLKYNHLRWGLGRVAWLESQLGISPGENSLSSDHGRARNEP